MTAEYSGPGKYNDALTAAVQAVGGLQNGPELWVLAVVGGPKGEGFEVQTTSPWALTQIPRLLRGLADDIERQQAVTPAGGPAASAAGTPAAER
jgi:hypothetical protein